MSSTTVGPPKPPVYDNRQAVTALIALIVSAALTLGILGVILLWTIQFAQQIFAFVLFIELVVVMIGGLVAARFLWKYYKDPRHCDPDDGRFLIINKMNILLLILGSDDDFVLLDQVEHVETPGSKFRSKYLNSATLVLDDRTFYHVRNVQHILDIIRYRQSLKSRGIYQTDELIRLALESNELQRTTNHHLREVIGLLKQISGQAEGSVSSEPPSPILDTAVLDLDLGDRPDDLDTGKTP